jgi:hypothetical protein
MIIQSSTSSNSCLHASASEPPLCTQHVVRPPKAGKSAWCHLAAVAYDGLVLLRCQSHTDLDLQTAEKSLLNCIHMPATMLLKFCCHLVPLLLLAAAAAVAAGAAA